ncbi:hypothetical protein F5884DRAFT_243136 [Xylogone sp. PMI_703]|nr:hypothetical protein F5884DRAFT_243136 [Xylogone sp. PMI_703]
MAGSVLNEKIEEAGLAPEHVHPLQMNEKEEKGALDTENGSRTEKAEEAEEVDTEIRDPLEPENDMQSIDHPSGEASVESPPTEKHVTKFPNGGLNAWLQVAGSFVLFMNSWCVLTLIPRG